MEAQRYPDDFDGIVAGAPANHYQEMNAVRVWLLQRMFRDDFAGALAFDTDGDGRFDSVRKLEILADAVLAACAGADGVADGVIDDPLACGFDARRDLAGHRCPGDVDGDACFTAAQVRTVADFHAGPRDGRGRAIYAGKPFGSERQWAGLFVPYTGNGFAPRGGAAGRGTTSTTCSTTPTPASRRPICLTWRHRQIAPPTRRNGRGGSSTSTT